MSFVPNALLVPYNTFIHVHVKCARPTRRSASAPPEYHVHLAIASTLAREQAARHRAKMRTQRACKRWCNLIQAAVQAASEAAEREELSHVSRVVAARAAQITPKLRVVLPASVYQEYAHHVFADMRDELQLRVFGVIRQQEQTVELWAADEPLKASPTMRALIEEAQRCLDVYDKGGLNLLLSGVVPVVIPYKKRMTLESLRKLVERATTVPAAKQVITHLGTVVKRGSLADQNITKGACLVVKPRDDCPTTPTRQ